MGGVVLKRDIIPGHGGAFSVSLWQNSEGHVFGTWCFQRNFLLKLSPDHTMALGSAQPLTEINTKNIYLGRG